MGYFTELNGSTSLTDGLKLYDYDISRRYGKGDEVLFRPLSFIWLAVQNNLFTYHTELWNISNLAIHTVNMALLFILLYTIQPSGFSLLFTLFIVTLRSSMALPVNQHLGGYMIGQGLYLAALIFFYKRTLSPEPERLSKELFFYTLLTTAACFFYEFIIPFSLMAVILIHLSPKTKITLKETLLLLLPVALYTLVYLTRDFSGADRFWYVDSWEHRNLFQGRTPGNILSHAYTLFYDIVTYVINCPRWQKIICVIFFTLTVFPALFSPAHPIPLKHRFFPLVLLGIYVLVLSFMRSGIFRDYYPYLFYILLVVFTYSLLDFQRLGSLRAFGLAVTVLFLIIFNFHQRQIESQADIQYYAPAARYLEKLVRFVDQKRYEPGFSFAIDKPDDERDPVYELKKGYPDGPDPVEFKRVSGILFAKYYKTTGYKYLLVWNDEKSDFNIKPIEQNALSS